MVLRIYSVIISVPMVVRVCTGDFAPPEPEFRAESWETNFGRPNFGPEVLGRIF